MLLSIKFFDRKERSSLISCMCNISLQAEPPGTLAAARRRAVYSNMVCSVTGVCSAANAFSTRFFRNGNCSSGLSLGSPRGCGMPTPGIMRLAPIVREIGVTVAICTTGMPLRSISFTIVAPQRVQVPQVEVSITAPMLSSSSFCTKLSPKPLELFVEVPVPVVETK